MKHFKYDVVKLIRAVKDRPVIWDKTLETYKDRVERKSCWDEIFRVLDDTYDDMTPEMKRATGEAVISRWTNVRDTFMRSLKNQKSGARKYIFHDQLSYLLKVAGELPEEEPLNESDDDPISYNMDIMKEEHVDIGEDGTASSVFVKEKREFRKSQRSQRNDEDSSSERETYTRKKRSKKRETEEFRKQTEDDRQSVDFVEVNEVNDPRVMNEDEAFFASLLPTIVKYSEDERLEFRIQVLAVMKGINDKRRQRWTDDPEERYAD